MHIVLEVICHYDSYPETAEPLCPTDINVIQRNIYLTQDICYLWLISGLLCDYHNFMNLLNMIV